MHSTVHRRSEEAALMASHFKGVRVSTAPPPLPPPAAAVAAAAAALPRVGPSPGRESVKVVGRGFNASMRDRTLLRMEAHRPFVLEGGGLKEEEEREEEREEEEEGVGGAGEEEEKPEEPKPPPPPTPTPPTPPPPPPPPLLLPEPPPLPLPLPPPIPPEGEDSSVESFPTRARTARVECRRAVGTTDAAAATTTGAAPPPPAAPVLAPETAPEEAPSTPAKVCRHFARAGHRGANG